MLTMHRGNSLSLLLLLLLVVMTAVQPHTMAALARMLRLQQHLLAVLLLVVLRPVIQPRLHGIITAPLIVVLGVPTCADTPHARPLLLLRGPLLLLLLLARRVLLCPVLLCS